MKITTEILKSVKVGQSRIFPLVNARQGFSVRSMASTVKVKFPELGINLRTKMNLDEMTIEVWAEPIEQKRGIATLNGIEPLTVPTIKN